MGNGSIVFCIGDNFNLYIIDLYTKRNRTFHNPNHKKSISEGCHAEGVVNDAMKQTKRQKQFALICLNWPKELYCLFQQLSIKLCEICIFFFVLSYS